MIVESLKQGLASSVLIVKRTRARNWRYSLEHAHAIGMIAANLRTQIEIFRVLARPACRDLVFTDSRFSFKYVIRNYLARGLTTAERAACFLHHYRSLNAAFPSSFLRQMFQQDVTVYEAQRAGSLYSITMGLSSGRNFPEGELCLALTVDGVRIYILQFTIVPGRIVGSQADDVLLVSQIQGMRGCYPLVSSATKAFQDVAPPLLLLGAMHGVARVLGIQVWAGVAAKNQTCYGQDQPDMFHAAYDEFFAELGATRTAADFFVSPVALEEKPLAPANNGHRARKKKRRAVRLQVANEVTELILRECSEAPSSAAEPARRPLTAPKPGCAV